MKSIPADEPILIFGSGPTLHHVFLAADKASAIDLGDYLPQNLHEIRRWLDRDPAAHNWRPFVRHTLACEGKTTPTPAEAAHREETARQKIRHLLTIDVRRARPLGDGNTKQYGTVISAYCADSATSNRREWAAYMNRIAALVRPGGTLLIAALRRSRGYVVGGKTFPSADIDEGDLQQVLETQFGSGNVTIEVREMPGTSSKGYSSILLARACSVRAKSIRAPQLNYRNSIWLKLETEASR